MKKIKLPLVVKVLIAIVLGVIAGQFAPGWLVRTTNTLVGIFDQLLRFFIKHVNKLRADELAFLFRLGDAFQFS